MTAVTQTCDGPDDARAAILYESSGNDLQGISNGEVRVALVDGKGLGLLAEECGQHHFSCAASGQELGVQNMNRLLQKINEEIGCNVQRCGRRP
jgi:hypothetical protein